MFIRAKYVLQFSRRNDRQNTAIGPAIENRRTVWTFLFEAAGRKVACENHLIFMQMTVQVAYIFILIVRTKTRFATEAKVNLGLGYSSMSCSESL